MFFQNEKQMMKSLIRIVTASSSTIVAATSFAAATAAGTASPIRW